MTELITIHTDGACRGNPGPGGWGAILSTEAHERELYGYESWTTNNRMELEAVIQALAAIKRPSRVQVVTDSQYVRNGITQWLPAWKRRGWRTAGRKPVRNVDLWQQLDEACARHEIDWQWVRGHQGHAGNERADELANRAIDEAEKR